MAQFSGEFREGNWTGLDSVNSRHYTKKESVLLRAQTSWNLINDGRVKITLDLYFTMVLRVPSRLPDSYTHRDVLSTYFCSQRCLNGRKSESRTSQRSLDRKRDLQKMCLTLYLLVYTHIYVCVCIRILYLYIHPHIYVHYMYVGRRP